MTNHSEFLINVSFSFLFQVCTLSVSIGFTMPGKNISFACFFYDTVFT